jgi:hypothetical protein
MKQVQKDHSQAWVKQLPRSKMSYPRSLRDRAKYVFWRAYTPAHPLFRDAALRLGMVKHKGRQNYLLGHIAPGQTVQEFVDYLVSKGFANHFVAWKDDGEVVSLRRVENFTHQYHLRIFADGEVRGHFEFTPECYPFSHLKAIGQENHPEVFEELFAGRVV